MEPYQQLEAEFAAWTGWPHVVACASGTAALHLALEALQLPAQSAVVVPEFTMIACARAVTLADLRVLPVDCNASLLLPAYFPVPIRPTAIMPVHIYGRRCDMNGIHEYAKQLGAAVIEDVAEAHGVTPHPETDAACWSFFKNKIVAGEEGGMVAFKREDHAERARMLRCMGFTNKHDFMHIPRGHNYRLANGLARLVLDSLHCFADNIKKRRQIVDWYDALVPRSWQMPPRDMPWVYDLRIPQLTPEQQDAIVATLNSAGITARHGFKPISAQPEYRRDCACPVARQMAQEVIYLPITPTMTQADVAANVDALLRCGLTAKRVQC
jgi:dTDP-4-amino-4,6-dideoxygalactose transaminase